MKRLIRGTLAVLMMAGVLMAVPSSVSATSSTQPGLVVSHKRLFINEGQSKTFTIKLATQPRIVDLETDIRVYSTVRVGFSSADTDVATVASTTAETDDDGHTYLTFTRDNWNVAQTITVSAVRDGLNVAISVTDEGRGIPAESDYDNLDPDFKVVALETERDDGTPTTVNAVRNWSSVSNRHFVYVSWSGFTPGLNNVYRRNISRGETGWSNINIGRISTYNPNSTYERDLDVQTGINLYRVGTGDPSDGVDALTMSHTVAVFFYTAGGA